MKVAVASDHGGFDLKEKIKDHLTSRGYEVIDLGCESTSSVDYPDYGQKLGEAVAEGTVELGVVVCGTGIGISISANKVPGVRAALCTDTYSAQMAREHNDANVLALGQRVTGEGLALKIVDTFFYAGFEGGRHERRVNKIKALEKRYGGN